MNSRSTKTTLRRSALKLDQGGAHPLYLFSLRAHEILEVAEISRVARDEEGRLVGYQRPEVRRHVQDIVAYLDSDKVVFPNSIILALSGGIRFRPTSQTGDGATVAGELEIQLPTNGSPKPGWIVDGQQRTMALARSRNADLPVPISAFVASDLEIQRDQFLRVNNTRPLPRSLITELLPEVSSVLPIRYAPRKLPAEICSLLNDSPASPFHRRIRRASQSPSERSRAHIADNSVVKMLAASLDSPSGILFSYRNLATGDADIDGIWNVLKTYWSAVAETFPEAWSKPPNRSRLTHGAGIAAMGKLMDRVMSSVDPKGRQALNQAQRELSYIRDTCSWTGGTWEGLGGLRWDEVQNVPSHIRMLSDHLVRTYLEQSTARQ